MPWTAIKISPGLIRNTTRYATAGTWFDGSLVRFRDGHPEKWAGWINAYPNSPVMTGMCRSLHRHGDLSGKRWISAGTSNRFYMISNESQNEVTPIAETAGPLVNPFKTTNGSKRVIVTDTSHGHHPGDFVSISGVTAAVGGIPATDFGPVPAYNPDGIPPPVVTDPGTEHRIIQWIDDDHYGIDVATTATSTVAAGGGATVTLAYVFRAGNNDVVTLGGWGRLSWGEGLWGDDPTEGILDQLGIWSQDNWGEDLVACAASGPIYYWDATNPANKMINILDIPPNFFGPGTSGADSNAPREAEFIVVSHRDRHLLAFGCTIYGDPNTYEPMTFRWCSQEVITNWNEADTTGTAGSLPLSNGTKFIAAVATTREILVWTDQALYSVQYIGSPLIYTAELLDRWSDICGMKAACSFNGIVYWMGQGGFYAYTGRTEKIPCPVWDYISVRLNRQQMPKVYASSNQRHNEVLWFYPSNNSGNLEIDSYVAYDVMQGLWHFGTLDRTAWMDMDAISPVIAAEPAKFPVGQSIPSFRLFEHDNGSDDGSTTPPSPIIAYLESGPIELSSEGSYDKGDKMMFVRRILPDVTFRNLTTSSSVPKMSIVLKMMDMPGGAFIDDSSSQVMRSATIPVEQFTRDAHVRLRGRSLTFRVESNTTGTDWRLGIPRIDARTDGQR